MHSPLELAPDHVEKIGLISVRWSALENGLAELLGRFLRVDHSGEAAYFAISNFSQRLGIISAVAEYSIENDRDAAVIARLLEKIEGLWGQRNKYIHSHFVHRTTYADGVQIMLYSDGGEPFRPSNLDSGDLQVVKSEFGYLRTKRKSPREFVPINLGALQNHANQVARRGRQIELAVKCLDTEVIRLRSNSPARYGRISPRAPSEAALAHRSTSGAFTSRVRLGWPERG